MQINKDRQFTSYSERKKPVDGILIHSIGESIEGQDGDSIDFLESIGLSAHYFITPSGEILQTLPTNKVAYHAGKSAWEGQKGLNSSFIGIEIMVSGRHDWGSFVQTIKDHRAFPSSQYVAVGYICDKLLNQYPKITLDRILRHSEVSGPNVRPDPKVDPGKGWSQDRLKQQLQLRGHS